MNVHPDGGGPAGPVAPGLPGSPWSPLGPAGPATVDAGPGLPAGPGAPDGPGTVESAPGRPGAPDGPAGPGLGVIVGAAFPGAPDGPTGPGIPATPCTPRTMLDAAGALGFTPCAFNCCRVVSNPVANLEITESCAVMCRCICRFDDSTAFRANATNAAVSSTSTHTLASATRAALGLLGRADWRVTSPLSTSRTPEREARPGQSRRWRCRAIGRASSPAAAREQ